MGQAGVIRLSSGGHCPVIPGFYNKAARFFGQALRIARYLFP
jgi:hypothetical protein